MQKRKLPKLSSLPLVLVFIVYYLVPATGFHELNHGIEDERKGDETSLAGQLEPLHNATEYRLVAASSLWSGQRRQLAPFELCLACKCCISGADPSTCTSMPCCFVIDCQLPNKPFGVCGFVPKTCKCTSCPAPV